MQLGLDTDRFLLCRVLIYVVIMWKLHWLCALDRYTEEALVLVSGCFLLPSAIVTTVAMRVPGLGSSVLVAWAVM